MKIRNLMILGAVVALACVPAFAQRQAFTPIDGAEFLTPVDSTADGATLLMTSLFGGGAFTYTDADGLAQIGNGGCSGQLRIAYDGSEIVGNERNQDGNCEAHKYLGNSQWQPMGGAPGGLPCGSSFSSSYDTNGDTAVGLWWTSNLCRAIGGTWDVASATGIGELISTVPNRPTRGNGITDDGNIVVGWQDNTFGFRQAARWVNGVQELFVDNAGQLMGEVIATNSDGSIMVGTGFNSEGRGWLRQADGTVIPMGVGGIGTNIQSVPIALSDDGTTVVGTARDFGSFTQRAWIWTAKKGFEFLEDFVQGNRAKGWIFQAASTISADGTKIGGWGFNPDGTPQGFIIELQRGRP